MIPHPITGRAHNIIAHSEYTLPDPGHTVTVLLFCIVGPFWLMYRLVKNIGQTGNLVTD